MAHDRRPFKEAASSYGDRATEIILSAAGVDHRRLAAGLLGGDRGDLRREAIEVLAGAGLVEDDGPIDAVARRVCDPIGEGTAA